MEMKLQIILIFYLKITHEAFSIHFYSFCKLEKRHIMHL